MTHEDRQTSYGETEPTERTASDWERHERLREAVETVVLAHSQGVLTERDYERLARMVETKP